MLVLTLVAMPLVLMGVAAAAWAPNNPRISSVQTEATTPVEPAALTQAGVATVLGPLENANS